MNILPAKTASTSVRLTLVDEKDNLARSEALDFPKTKDDRSLQRTGGLSNNIY